MFGKGWAMAAVGIAAVLAVAFAACADDEDEVTVVPTRTAAPEATATAVATPTVPAVDADPANFREFADLVARAAAEEDSVFFTSRVQAEPYTCTETEVTQGALGGAEPGLCQEAGQQRDLVLLCGWLSECVYTLPESLVAQIENYFAQAAPAEEDDLGTGAVRLFATATTRPGRYEGRTLHAAILTVIAPLPGQPDAELLRTAPGVDFEYVGGRWVIRGMLVAVFPQPALVDQFLSPDTGPYAELEPY